MSCDAKRRLPQNLSAFAARHFERSASAGETLAYEISRLAHIHAIDDLSLKGGEACDSIVYLALSFSSSSLLSASSSSFDGTFARASFAAAATSGSGSLANRS
jgi:hypothetical protein